MPPASRVIALANGLQATIIHQPDAAQAAALAQVAAGSHDEPTEWPGLAHLLEHLLFAGDSHHPAAEEGFMRWVQRMGGNVNATTLPRRSAFFFDVPPAQLAEGVQRLRDMLQAPALEMSAIAGEVAVIDAENQLIQRHEPSRREAAARYSAVSPAAFRRFHVGSAASLHGEGHALREALRRFHQRYYTSAPNLQLWLQGPQSLDELTALADQFAVGFHPGPPHRSAPAIQLACPTDGKLYSEAEPTFCYCPLITLDAPHVAANLALFREFLLDAAPGGLLATLRERKLADDVSLEWLYQDAENGWLMLNVITTQPDDVNALLIPWFEALGRTTSTQQQHYYQLAQRRFAALSPLESLRQRAFGFAPVAPFADFHRFCARLRAAPTARLWCSASPVAQSIATQGLALPLTTWRPRATTPAPLKLAFYPLAAPPLAAPALPATEKPLLHLPGNRHLATLVVRPGFNHNLTPAQGAGIACTLRPLFAMLRHAGGHGEWLPVQGCWQLTLQLPTASPVMGALVRTILHSLATLPESAPTAQESVAIRRLIATLPGELNAPTSDPAWIAALVGGSAADRRTLSRGLSLLDEPKTLPRPESSSPDIARYAHADGDNALLLFIPRPPGHSLAALRALALICTPQFFQRLRVEQPIGYVVSSRYLRCADCDGLLFALQSPTHSTPYLLSCCERFLRELSLPDEAALLSLKAQLTDLLPSALSPAEQALAALRRRYGLPELTPDEIKRLSLADLTTLYAQLLHQRGRWKVLDTQTL